MSGPVPVLGYPSKSQAAVALREQGLSHGEIGRMVGVPTAIVSALIASGLRATRPVPPSASKITLTLSAGAITALRQAADARGTAAELLAARVLMCAARDSLIDAILDDGSPS